MKKGVFIVLGTAVIISVLYWSRSKVFNDVVIKDLGVQSGSHYPTPTPQKNGSNKSGRIKIESQSYSYDVWTAHSPQALKLVANYSEMKNTNRLMDEYSCTYGINGGLYDDNHKPLGLVVINSLPVAKYRTSQTFNGVVGVLATKEFYIGDNFEQKFTYAVQTGPVLIKNGALLDLRLIRDKNARRMVAIKDVRGNLHMAAIYGVDSNIDGPLLDQLPQAIQKLSEDSGFEIDWAINLDGGSASALRSGQIQIEEWQPVGSWWCYV